MKEVKVSMVRLTSLQDSGLAVVSSPSLPETLSSSPAEELDEAEEEPKSMDAMDLEEDEVLTVARETVVELLQKMHIDADVTAVYQEQEEDRRHRPNVMVEINGDDLSILIGRQAETLNALQYITRLIVGKELNRGVDLEVDVQGYRIRRNEQLRRLARQMADQAARTGKRQYLEPMASDDRRIIHIELRNHAQVFTESMGEGDRRKVTIVPK
jgi:spoIIIJ-associated protein